MAGSKPRRIKVYVDAKITERHKANAEHKTSVAFIADHMPDLCGFDSAEGEQSHRAEEAAMLFAIRKLTKSPTNLNRFTIVCDNKSAVLRAKWKGKRRKSKGDQTLEDLWKEVDANPEIRIRTLETNLAHAYLNLRLKQAE
ncbi:MAG: hypothetical protein ABSB26_08530 [Nitrososphaerales archaeon]|jgi:hypothetical protein